MLKECRIYAGPSYAMLGQNVSSISSAYRVRWVSLTLDPLSPHDALKHHFTSLT